MYLKNIYILACQVCNCSKRSHWLEVMLAVNVANQMLVILVCAQGIND